jgi:glycosyltransferase involved in cell wall biosynthesis
MTPPVLVSVIIPFVKVDSAFRRAVASVAATDYPHESREIIVVFNGKDAAPILDLRTSMPDVTCIISPVTNAYAARNAGALQARGDILLFTDADCVVDRHWVLCLIRPLLADNDIAAVYGNVRAHEPKTALEIFGNDHVLVDARRPFDYLTGANCAIRKQVFEQLKGFDATFLSGGDMDLSIRLANGGLRNVNEPAALVYHKHRFAVRDLFLQYRKYGHGWKQLHGKWGRTLPLYLPIKRPLVAAAFLFLFIFEALRYMLETKSIERKARRFKFFYLAVMNLGIFVGYYFGIRDIAAIRPDVS